jgi:hypothetical protein
MPGSSQQPAGLAAMAKYNGFSALMPKNRFLYKSYTKIFYHFPIAIST